MSEMEAALESKKKKRNGSSSFFKVSMLLTLLSTFPTPISFLMKINNNRQKLGLPHPSTTYSLQTHFMVLEENALEPAWCTKLGGKLGISDPLSNVCKPVILYEGAQTPLPNQRISAGHVLDKWKVAQNYFWITDTLGQAETLGDTFWIWWGTL